MIAVTESVVEHLWKGQYIRAIKVQPKHDQASDALPAVVFLPSGLKYSVGPQRMFVKYSRQLAQLGCVCYRLDPIGLGLSDGVIDSGETKEVWQTVEKGRFVNDVAFFISKLKAETPWLNIVLCGLCGGAVTSELLSLKYDGLVDGIISINTAVKISQTKHDSIQKESNEKVNVVMQGYFKKLFSIEAWRRILFMESDLKGIIRIVTLFFIQYFRKTNEALREVENINRDLIFAYEEIQRKNTPHLILFSDKDNRWLEFKDTFYKHLMNEQTKIGQQTLQFICNANHELQFYDWQQDAYQKIEAWLTQQFDGAAK